jgi:hypothetical protein
VNVTSLALFQKYFKALNEVTKVIVEIVIIELEKRYLQEK